MAANTRAHISPYEVKQAEDELMDLIKITDTFVPFDTLTVSEALVKNPSYFEQLGKRIVKQNFLRSPNQTEWIER